MTSKLEMDSARPSVIVHREWITLPVLDDLHSQVGTPRHLAVLFGHLGQPEAARLLAQENARLMKGKREREKYKSNGCLIGKLPFCSLPAFDHYSSGSSELLELSTPRHVCSNLSMDSADAPIAVGGTIRPLFHPSREWPAAAQTMLSGIDNDG